MALQGASGCQRDTDVLSTHLVARCAGFPGPTLPPKGRKLGLGGVLSREVTSRGTQNRHRCVTPTLTWEGRVRKGIMGRSFWKEPSASRTVPSPSASSDTFYSRLSSAPLATAACILE